MTTLHVFFSGIVNTLKRHYKKVRERRVVGSITKDLLELCVVLDNGELVCNWSYERAHVATHSERPKTSSDQESWEWQT